MRPQRPFNKYIILIINIHELGEKYPPSDISGFFSTLPKNRTGTKRAARQVK